jgi:hypothetical protein
MLWCSVDYDMLAEIWIVAHLPYATLMSRKSAISQSIVTEQTRGEVVLRAIARHLVLFSYHNDQISPRSFLTSKNLPLWKTKVGLSGSHNEQTSRGHLER